MGAHVWTDRAYGWYTGDSRDCTVATRGAGKNHFVYRSQNGEGNMSGANFDSHSNHGSKWLQKFYIAANSEEEVSVILDWNRANVQKDWSLTAWGIKGLPVSVTHTGGLSTDRMPLVGENGVPSTHRSAPEEIKVPELPPMLKTCSDTNGDKKDVDGDGCTAYWRDQSWCGNYDAPGFVS